MWFNLFVVALLMLIGSITFGHFEEKKAKWRKLLKAAIFVGVTALLSWTVGRFWALVWVFGFAALGLSYHVWWCKKHGIGVLSAEPRDKYYQLRGWK